MPQPHSPAEAVAQRPPIEVMAIIPNRWAPQLVIQNQDFPHAEHEMGSGTTEATLRMLGKRSIGMAVSPQFGRFFAPTFLVYFAKPVTPEEIQLQSGASWIGMDDAAQLEPFAQTWRWWQNQRALMARIDL